ncbi:DUF4920 domain-containing protein [Thalassobellus sediminis]|uniref:DUF4920 domain-containing protein n=1 Tax=Thalassobellus sediminis TaxID=3367753 RepID=UPI00378D7BEC
MKTVFLVILCVLMLNACKNKKEEISKTTHEVEVVNYKSFGNKIISNDAIAVSSMAYHYKTMVAGDSINSKMIAKVNSVCQAKGCWMRLDLEDGTEVMVKFKDYGFFMPKDITGKEVIINGKAFVEEVSVDEQRHYAEDIGKTKEEIALITKPKRTYSFEADGVLLKQ